MGVSVGGVVVGGLFLAAVLAATGGVVYGRVRPVSVPRTATWGDSPVSFEPAEGVDAVELAKAVLWWRGHGHDVMVRTPGDVRVEVSDLGPALRGLTLREDYAGTVIAATILVSDGGDTLAIAHEIGHALGYEHARWAPSGHLMAAEGSRAGWDGRGLDRRGE